MFIALLFKLSTLERDPVREDTTLITRLHLTEILKEAQEYVGLHR